MPKTKRSLSLTRKRNKRSKAQRRAWAMKRLNEVKRGIIKAEEEEDIYEKGYHEGTSKTKLLDIGDGVRKESDMDFVDGALTNQMHNKIETEIDIIYELNNNEAFADEVYKSLELCIICAKDLSEIRTKKSILKYLDLILNVTNVDLTKYPVQLNCCPDCYFCLLQINRFQRTLSAATNIIFKKLEEFYKGYINTKCAAIVPTNTGQNNSVSDTSKSSNKNIYNTKAVTKSSLSTTDEDPTVKTELEDSLGDIRSICDKHKSAENIQRDVNVNNKLNLLEENENIFLFDTSSNRSFLEKETSPVREPMYDFIPTSVSASNQKEHTITEAVNNIIPLPIYLSDPTLTPNPNLFQDQPSQATKLMDEIVPFESLSSKSNIVLQNGKYKIKCRICPKILGRSYYPQHLYMHRMSKRITNTITRKVKTNKTNTITRKAKTNISRTACPICGKLVADYRSHAFTHESVDVSCEQCGKKIKAHNLYKHKRRHQDKEEGKQIRICYQCGKSFHSDSSLKRHEVTHREKQHKCQLCGKSFYFVKYLDRHMRSHTGEKPFACTYCNRTFSLRWNMLQHIRLHTNSKPYKCKLCSACFRHNVTLKGHLKSAHSADEFAKLNDNEKNDDNSAQFVEENNIDNDSLQVEHDEANL